MPAERKIENNDIYSTILNMIKEINYSTDAIFTSNTLSDELGISRGVARETLIKLCQDGILKPIPRMGYRVIQLTKSDIEDAIQTRIIIESGAMRMILPAITEAELDVFIERVHPSYDFHSLRNPAGGFQRRMVTEILGNHVKGNRHAAIKAARSMLADGLVPPDKVAEYSGLSLGEVENLKNSLNM